MGGRFGWQDDRLSIAELVRCITVYNNPIKTKQTTARILFMNTATITDKNLISNTGSHEQINIDKYAAQFFTRFEDIGLNSHADAINLSKSYVVSNFSLAITLMGWDVEICRDGIEGERGCDIYAQKGNGKIAVNICFDAIDMAQIKRRQADFKKNGVRGLWLLKPCVGAVCSLDERIDYNSNEIPIFHIMQNTGMTLIHGVQYFNDGSFGDEVGFYEVPLDPFFLAYFLFRKEIAFKPRYDNDVFLQGVIQERTCFKCQEKINTIHKIVYIRRIFGQLINEDYYQAPDIREVPESEIELINRSFSHEHNFNPAKPMYSKFLGASYMANSCSCCGVIMGAFFESTDFYSPVTFTNITASTLSAESCFAADEMDNGIGAWILQNDSGEVDNIIEDLLDLGIVDFDKNGFFPLWFSLLALPDYDDEDEYEDGSE